MVVLGNLVLSAETLLKPISSAGTVEGYHVPIDRDCKRCGGYLWWDKIDEEYHCMNCSRGVNMIIPTKDSMRDPLLPSSINGNQKYTSR